MPGAVLPLGGPAVGLASRWAAAAAGVAYRAQLGRSNSENGLNITQELRAPSLHVSKHRPQQPVPTRTSPQLALLPETSVAASSSKAVATWRSVREAMPSAQPSCSPPRRLDR